MRIPMDELSQQDRSFIELKNPPKVKINFTKTTKQRKTPIQAESAEKHHPSPKIEFMTFFVSLKKASLESLSSSINGGIFCFWKRN